MSTSHTHTCIYTVPTLTSYCYNTEYTHTQTVMIGPTHTGILKAIQVLAAGYYVYKYSMPDTTTHKHTCPTTHTHILKHSLPD